MTELSETGHPL